MPMVSVARLLPAFALGLALAANPLTVSTSGLDDQPAFAKNGGGGGGGGGGRGGGNGGGRGNGNGNGNGGGGGNGNGNGHGNGGSQGADTSAAADVSGQGVGKTKLAGKTVEADALGLDGLSANQLGRLNGFMNASPNALANASPNSAIGVVAQSYREALSEYAAGAGAEPDDEDAVIDPALDLAARALALAANKELTPDVVAAVNARLAETYADEPALAGFADPTSPESQEAAEAIAALAESYQAEEANQGLGSGLDEHADDDLDHPDEDPARTHDATAVVQ